MRLTVCMSIDKGFGSIVLEGDSHSFVTRLFMPFRFHYSFGNQDYRSRYFSYGLSFSECIFQLGLQSCKCYGAAHCFAKRTLTCNFVGSFGVGFCPSCLEAAPPEKDAGPSSLLYIFCFLTRKIIFNIIFLFHVKS